MKQNKKLVPLPQYWLVVKMKVVIFFYICHFERSKLKMRTNAIDSNDVNVNKLDNDNQPINAEKTDIVNEKGQEQLVK